MKKKTSWNNFNLVYRQKLLLNLKSTKSLINAKAYTEPGLAFNLQVKN